MDTGFRTSIKDIVDVHLVEDRINRLSWRDFGNGLSMARLAKDGKRELFDRAKLERAIGHSCRKRDIDPAKVDQLISGVQRQMETQGDEVTSARIGEAVMAGLKALDHVAYIRFASIYKDFSDPGDFAAIAERVEKEAVPTGQNKLL